MPELTDAQEDRLRRNCCKYCGRSLEPELDSDVLLHAGACLSCAEEEREHHGYDDRDDYRGEPDGEDRP